MKSILFVMLFIAPLVQIGLSVLRICNKIKLSLIAIGILTALLGFFLSVQASSMVSYTLSHSNIRCGTIEVAFLFIGFIITIVAIPIIGIISFIIYRITHKGVAQP